MSETISELTPREPGLVNVIQITDTHILDDGAPSFNDFDTSASLMRIVDEIKQSEADADLILVTGDLVHEATETAYQKLADHLSVLTIPVFYLPGNHDVPSLMDYVLGANGYQKDNLIQLEDWLIILLNTCSIGEHQGELTADELAFLQQSLAKHTDKHCLIALHHHPVPINSRWMDAMSLVNADAFWETLEPFDHVRGIIWGHIHQKFEQKKGQIRLMGSPSTCLQFIPGSDEFAVDNKGPAYRKLCLKKDGSIDSNVMYLAE